MFRNAVLLSDFQHCVTDLGVVSWILALGGDFQHHVTPTASLEYGGLPLIAKLPRRSVTAGCYGSQCRVI